MDTFPDEGGCLNVSGRIRKDRACDISGPDARVDRDGAIIKSDIDIKRN